MPALLIAAPLLRAPARAARPAGRPAPGAAVPGPRAPRRAGRPRPRPRRAPAAESSRHAGSCTRAVQASSSSSRSALLQPRRWWLGKWRTVGRVPLAARQPGNERICCHMWRSLGTLRAGPPPRRQAPVELERVPGAAVGHAVLAAQEQLAVERELEVDAPVVDAPVRFDPERQRVGEIALGQKRLERLDVLRQPQVVVGEVADDLATSLAQRRVPVLLPVARPLRVVEEPHARIGRGRALPSARA